MIENLKTMMGDMLNLADNLIDEFNLQKFRQSDLELKNMLDSDDFNMYILYRESIYELETEISDMTDTQLSYYCILVAQVYLSGIILLKYAQQFKKDNVIVDSIRSSNTAIAFDPTKTVRDYISMYEDMVSDYMEKSGFDYSYSSGINITFAGVDKFEDEDE